MPDKKKEVDKIFIKAAELHSRGNLRKARELYEDVVKLDERNAKAYVLLGNIIYQTGDVVEAERHYNKAIEIDPEHAIAYFNIAMIRQDCGDLDGAVEFFKKTIEKKPDYPEAYSNLGAVLRDKGDLLGALKNFKKALEMDGKSEVSKKEVEKILGRVQEEVRRREIIREAEELLLEGGAMVDEGHLDRAVEFFKRAMELNPASMIPYYLLGLAYEKMGNFRLARETYRLTLGLDKSGSKDVSPKLIGLLERLTNVSFQGVEGFSKRVASFLEKLKEKPDEVLSFKDFIKSETRQEMLEHFLRLGVEKESHGDIDGAVMEYRKAIKANPRSQVPYYMLGLVLESMGEMEAAIENYQKAVSLVDTSDHEASRELSVLLSNRLGGVEMRASELSEMLKEFKGATDRENKATFGAMIQRRLSKKSVEELKEGYLLDIGGDAERALEKFRQAAWVDQNNVLSYIVLGLAEENLDRSEEAMKEYRKLDKIDFRKATREIPNEVVDIVNDFMTRTTSSGHKVGKVLASYIELVSKNPDKMLDLLGYIEDLKLDSITDIIRGHLKRDALTVKSARIIRDVGDFPESGEERTVVRNPADVGADLVELIWKYKTARTIRCIAIDPMGKGVLAGSETGLVYYLDEKGGLIAKLDMETAVVDLDISGGGAFGVVALQNGVVKQIDLKKRVVSWEIDLSDSGPRSVAISYDGKHVAVGFEDSNIAKLSGGKVEWIRATRSLISKVDISMDGFTIVGASEDGSLHVIKEKAGLAPMEDFIRINKSLRAIALSPDGKFTAVGTDEGSIYMLDEKKNVLWKRELGQVVVYGLAISAEGKYAVAGSSNGKATLYDGEGKVRWEYSTGENIWGADISEDGKNVTLGCGLVFGNVYLLKSEA